MRTTITLFAFLSACGLGPIPVGGGSSTDEASTSLDENGTTGGSASATSGAPGVLDSSSGGSLDHGSDDCGSPGKLCVSGGPYEICDPSCDRPCFRSLSCIFDVFESGATQCSRFCEEDDECRAGPGEVAPICAESLCWIPCDGDSCPSGYHCETESTTIASLPPVCMPDCPLTELFEPHYGCEAPCFGSCSDGEAFCWGYGPGPEISMCLPTCLDGICPESQWGGPWTQTLCIEEHCHIRCHIDGSCPPGSVCLVYPGTDTPVCQTPAI